MKDNNLRLKLQLLEPPIGYAFCLQKGKGAKAERLDYIEIDPEGESEIEFELEVEVRVGRNRPEPDFFGPFVQGNEGARFFYLCVGNYISDGVPHWAGRVKVPLIGIDWPKVGAAEKAEGFLTARYQASRADGQPVYASVKLLDEGWTVRRDDEADSR